MTLFLISLIAGMLTVLAPCILPLLPVVIGGSVGNGRNRFAPLVIIMSLGLSVVVFTLVLKVSTAFIAIPQSVWGGISGGILIIFGLVTLFPTLWERIALRIGFGAGANRLLTKGYQKKGITGDMIIGFALGPIFSTCSPTYVVILATVLPQSFALGMLYLLTYVLGLSVMLLLIAFIGQRIIVKLNLASDPRGWFKRGLGALFLVIGVLIFLGIDKKVETVLVNSNVFSPIIQIEEKLLEKNR